ncbi:MAG: archease [Firmicutes bacterium]|nr:archease [Bacillota bacterium]
MPSGWRWLEHTADVGLEVEAGDLPSLFAALGEATLALLLERPPHRPRRGRGERALQLEAPDLEGLVVRWVDELLYLVQTRSFVPARWRLEVTPGEGEAPWRLAARLEGVPLEPGRMGFRGEVKAATRHRLLAGREAPDGRWRVRLYLDV